MRIVIDMQGAQAENRNRGIGRYALSITKAIIRHSGAHEIIVLLNGLFPETIEPLRAEFDSCLDQKQIIVWTPDGPLKYLDLLNTQRRIIAEFTYEAFIAEHRPDFIYVTSVFEGFIDDAVSSIHALQNIAPVAVTLYDLIPFISPTPYLDNPLVHNWYMEKIAHLKKADLWFGISESACMEGIKYLGFDPARTCNISTDADDKFQKVSVLATDEHRVRHNYNLVSSFVLYTGGIDHRKNIEGLIRAYAMVPFNIRKNYQLTIVCLVQPDRRKVLERLAAKVGLKKSELVLTGFVPDEDLIILYNLCHLFVFPSWHEGFGLPALEAMRCGAPVIGSSLSSLPEVIGWEGALFDPKSDSDMAAAIQRGLTDDQYRSALLLHQKAQVDKFSWEKTAIRAISAMEAWLSSSKVPVFLTKSDMKKPKLAYVSPVPPAKSGIATYSAELLLNLSSFYDIDVIVEEAELFHNDWNKMDLPVRSVSWLINNKSIYERVVFHFGNSAFHQHMFNLLEKIPGIVVLHDFFLSGIQAHREISDAPGAWVEALFKSHGYKALQERLSAEDPAAIGWKYPANLCVLQQAKGLIFHSEHAINLLQDFYSVVHVNDCYVIPLLRLPAPSDKCNKLRHALGFSDNDLIVCSFGVLGCTKLNLRLLDAWIKSPLKDDRNAYLVFVGSADDGEYCYELRKKIKSARLTSNIKITGWIDDNTYKQFLEVADIAVQLRTLSRGETSAAVLDCMNYGIATIVNKHGSMAEIDPQGAWILNDTFSDTELIDALTSLANDSELRVRLGKTAKTIIRTKHQPEQCAKKYYNTIENIYRNDSSGFSGLINFVASEVKDQVQFETFAISAAKHFPARIRQKQLFIDISELVQRDAQSGIQRVVRAILQQLLQNPPAGYRVEPVYAYAEQQGYWYARKFTCQFMGLPDIGLQDEPVDAWAGDIFLGLDFQPVIVQMQTSTLKQWYNSGIKVWFVIYDLLPILFRVYCPLGADMLHNDWLKVITAFDGVICISQSVASEYKKWFSEHKSTINRLRPIQVEWFHLGVEARSPSNELCFKDETDMFFEKLSQSISFLIVGTIEPRKGHTQVLDAFELLWANGKDLKLVIVGKQGWMVSDLIRRLHNHPQVNIKLFWLEGTSDECLAKLYKASTCLIAASYGEGFGLPLIEAAQNKLPIIARDIPVFREVAGNNAFYFASEAPADLACSIADWLLLYQKNKHPCSAKMPWLSWESSSQKLLDVIIP